MINLKKNRKIFHNLVSSNLIQNKNILSRSNINIALKIKWNKNFKLKK